MSTRPPCPSCGKISFTIYRQLTKGRKSLGFKSIPEVRECRHCGFIFKMEGEYSGSIGFKITPAKP